MKRGMKLKCRRLKAELALIEIAMEVGLLKPDDTDFNIKYSEIVDAVKKQVKKGTKKQ